MKRGDALIVLALLALAGALFLLRPLPGGTGVVYINGEQATASMTVNGVVVEIDGLRTRVVSSPCRDKLCVNAGWLERPGEIAVCLPQRVVVEIRGVREGVDSIAY